jgi:hypothetical protein
VSARVTLIPGRNGTKKLLRQYGDRLLRVRYRYDSTTGRRQKTVELLVEDVPWIPARQRTRRPPPGTD